MTVVVIGGLGTVAILIARGNTISWNGVSSTGSIRLSINGGNSNSAVYLNEERKSIDSDNTLGSLTPGDYELKVSKSNYSTWEQKVTVKAGLITDVPVQLFPDTYQLEQLTTGNISYFTTSATRRYVYYIISDNTLNNNSGLWQQSIQQNAIPLIQEQPVKLSNLTDELKTALANNQFVIWPSANDSKLLISTGTKLYVIDTGRYNEPDLTNILTISYPITHIEWLSDSSNILIISNNILLDYNLTSKISSIITYVPGTDPIYAVTSNQVFFFENQKLYKYTPGSKSEITLQNIQIPTDITNIYAPSGNVQSLVLRSKDGIAYYLNTTNNYIAKLGEYQFLSVSPDGNHIFLTANEIVKSVQVVIRLTSNSVETTIQDTTIKNTIKPESILWSAISNYVIYQYTDSPEKLYSADSMGNNVTELNLPNAYAHLGYINTSDNLGLVMSLQDSLNSDTRVNLYKLKF